MSDKAPQISLLLMTLMCKGVNEMRLSVGRPPVLRLDEEDRPLNTKSLEAGDLQRYVEQIAPKEVRQACESAGRTEFGLKFSAQGQLCNLAVVLSKRAQGYELLFRMVGPIERDPARSGPMSELSEDVN